MVLPELWLVIRILHAHRFAAWRVLQEGNEGRQRDLTLFPKNDGRRYDAEGHVRGQENRHEENKPDCNNFDGSCNTNRSAFLASSIHG